MINIERTWSVVERPWGYFEVLDDQVGYKVKILSVNPGQRLSLQYHNHRKEKWTVLSGVAKIWLKDRELILLPAASVDIDIGESHRLENPSDKINLRVLEVAFGESISEEDIHRLSDDYGRVSQ